MLWTHPLLLAGLGALAVPVLIHLLMRAQGRKVRFGTLRFLPQTKPARERRKIRHWPLLLLRLLLLALLVLAFARPYWPQAAGSAASRQRSRAIVLVLDRSASMQAREGSVTRWGTALAITDKWFDTLSENDRVAVVAFAGQAEVIVPWGPGFIARRAVKRLKVANETGQVVDGLRVAATLLEQAPAGAELVLVSDLQKSSCTGIDAVSLPTGTHCDIRQEGAPQTGNVAVTGVRNESSAMGAVTVDLRNYSAQAQAAVPVTCLLDHQSFFQGKIDIIPGGMAHLTLPAIRGAPGWHQLQVEAASNDALSSDNQYFAAVFIPQPISVLVAEPHPEKKNFARSSYFLTSALNPNYSENAAAPPATGPFDVTVVDSANIVASLASASPPAVVVLPSLADLPADLGDKLASYLRNGGGLLAWISVQTDTLAYNNQFGAIWPARLIEPESYATLHAGQGWRLGWWNRESALFGPIGEEGRGDLTLPQFKQRLRLEVDPQAQVLAAFEDKVPFIITRQVGRGRVLLVNTSADTSGSDWPIHKTYLPVVQRMTYYLARRDPQADFSIAPSMAPARHALLNLGVGLAKRSFQLVAPAGPPVSIKTDEVGVAHDADMEQIGGYEIRGAPEEIQQMRAVNFPGPESDLSAYRPEEISSRLRFAPSIAAHFSSAGAFASRREAWPWLFGSLLPLLLIELTWANRTRT